MYVTRIDQTYKSHNAPFPFLSIHNSQQTNVHISVLNGVLCYGTGKLWDFGRLVYFVISSAAYAIPPIGAWPSEITVVNANLYMMPSSNGNISALQALYVWNWRETGDFPSQRPYQWRRALMFSLICVWINCWVWNREAGHLRHHRAHNDILVMSPQLHRGSQINLNAKCLGVVILRVSEELA